MGQHGNGGDAKEGTARTSAARSCNKTGWALRESRARRPISPQGLLRVGHVCFLVNSGIPSVLFKSERRSPCQPMGALRWHVWPMDGELFSKSRFSVYELGVSHAPPVATHLPFPYFFSAAHNDQLSSTSSACSTAVLSDCLPPPRAPANLHFCEFPKHVPTPKTGQELMCHVAHLLRPYDTHIIHIHPYSHLLV